MRSALAQALDESLASAGYELLDRLHRSNGFDVYDAWSVERRSRVVIKTPRPDRLDDHVLLRRLEREGRLLSGLSHPHILRGYEVLPAPVPAIVTETLRGETLSHLVGESNGLSAAETAVLGLQLSSAAGYLHRQGYLHLDLKPSNIVVDAGRAILIDLSIARKPGPATPGLGTWCYLAPEQAVGRLIGPEADAWGIGAVLFAALTARAPFGDSGADESAQTTDDDHDDTYPQLTERAPLVGTLVDLPSSLAGIVDACLEPDPWRRPTVEELAAALEAVPGAGSPRAVRR